jgi:hypothetical protein
VHGKGKLIKKFQPLMAVPVFLQLLFMARPCRAETNWYDFSGSLNNSFSGNQLFSPKNILGIILLLVIFAVVYQVLKLSWQKEEKTYHQRRRTRVPLRPLNPLQKRYWFRLETDTQFEWITAEEAYNAKRNQYKKDRLVDISGGGLCFTTAEKVEPGDELKLLVPAGKGKILNINGTVVRAEAVEGPEGAMYRVSIQYKDIRSGERDCIVNMIMNRQRDTIQKEKTPPLQPGPDYAEEDIYDDPEAEVPGSEGEDPEAAKPTAC